MQVRIQYYIEKGLKNIIQKPMDFFHKKKIYIDTKRCLEWTTTVKKVSNYK